MSTSKLINCVVKGKILLGVNSTRTMSRILSYIFRFQSCMHTFSIESPSSCTKVVVPVRHNSIKWQTHRVFSSVPLTMYKSSLPRLLTDRPIRCGLSAVFLDFS